jgi:hypothetical protein
MSYKDVANLREVAARMRYKFDPDDARSVWKKVRSRNFYMCNKLMLNLTVVVGSC